MFLQQAWRWALSGITGILAAPLRGRQSSREDGRLERLKSCCAVYRCGDSRAARMAAFGPSLALPAYRRHCQGSDGAVGAEQRESAEMSSRGRKHRARMRPPPPTATRMKARRMIDAMTGTELPAVAQDCCHEVMRQEPSCQENASEER